LAFSLECFIYNTEVKITDAIGLDKGYVRVYLKQDFVDEDPRTSRRFLKTIKRPLDISDPMEIAGCLAHVCLPLKHNICVRAK